MKKAVVFLFSMALVMFSGCNLLINSDSYNNESIDMTPRQISVSQNSSTVEVVKQVKSAVVGISSKIYGGYSIGSGVAISDGGYILTNQHVISGASYIDLYFADKTTARAQLIWQDASLDLAVIKSSVNIPYLECEEEGVEVGEDVIAIGTPLSLDFGHSVTKGIVSALNRTLVTENDNGTVSYMQSLIQHDASINPGNSGGPIINSQGKVVGINTLKASDAEGMGFAIPISIGKETVKKLSQNETWQPSYMGIFAIDLDVAKFNGEKINSTVGVYIADIDENSLCKDCFKKGDIITSINGNNINSILDLRTCLYKFSSGDNLEITVIRNDKLIIIRSHIGSR